jgi:hypothetical protein
MATTKVSLGRQTDLNAGGSVITQVGTPSAGTDAANKNYVDAAAQGIDWKASVRAATTAAGTLASSFENGDAIDGVTLATGDRILIKNQAAGAENGIYTVNASGAPTRATDADTNAEVTAGMSVFVEEGTTNADSGWVLTNNGAIVVGTTALTFTQFTGLGQITTDSTIDRTGNQLSRAAITGDISISAGSNTSAIGANKVTLGMQATLAANSAIANATGSTATPTAVPMVSAATASAIAIRDSSANAKFNNLVENLATTATAAGTTTLTVASAKTQQFTGSTTQTVVMPDATTLSVGHSFTVTNRSSGVVTVNANGGGLLQSMAAGSQATFTAVTIGTSAGTWDVAYSVASAGTVTAVSVVSANGFAGSSSGGSTPALTLSTTITGLLKGNGTAISAATAGTDYLAPANFVDRETPSGSVNGSNTAFTLANTPVSGSEHVYLNGLLQEPGAGNDYTISGSTITYLTAPQTGDKIRVSYRK